MLYVIKRYAQTRFKSFENRFNTWEKKKEINKAYKADKTTVGISIPRPLLIKTVIGIVCSVLIITGAIYTGRLVKKIDFSSFSKKKVKKLSKNDVEKAHALAVSQYEAKDSSHNKKNNLVKIPPKKIDSILPPQDKRAYKFPDVMSYFILANKATDTMYFLKNVNTTWSVFRKYSIAYGAREGRKLKEGDKKTPEGLYFVTGRKEKNELHKMYGPLAFILNYPNKEDRKAGRTGNGIWIHGTNPDSIPNNTRGCLELDNVNLSELGSIIKLGVGVPVYIINKKLEKPPEKFPDYVKIEAERKSFFAEYRQKRDFFIAILNNWEDAWESKKIENYEKHYSADQFFSQGMGWDVWKVKKSHTFKMYTKIDISVDNIFLADFSESTAVLKFIQSYESNRFKTVDGKKLSLVKQAEQWKICKENPIPKEELLL